MYKVAVLLSTYNGSKYIKEQIDSILSQEGVNIDIYIRDDGSTDETVNIIYEYKSNNIFLTEGENIGVVIIPGLFEPPVRTLRATIPENESHIFR